tara:strand:+ start:13806 stop:14417 length:612 start_codon:yes stop_codon:yes gene_type:complete
MANGNFWANSNAIAKRKYRYILDVGYAGGANLPSFEKWVVQKVTRPSFSISETTHSYLNHTFYFPGRLTWNDVSFTVVDAVVPDSTGVLMGMLAASGYVLPKQSDSATSQGTISKANSTIKCVLTALDQDGGEIDKWTLHNAWILSANLGDYDYTSDDLMSIDIALKYDYATYEIMASKAEGQTSNRATKKTRDNLAKIQLGN